MTITEFLLARIAEDEDLATEALPRESDVYGARGWYDPARVLAECAAKRLVMAEVFDYEQAEDNDRGDCCSLNELKAGECRYIKPEKIPSLQALATVYADHPDYRPDWALNTPST